MPLAQKSRSRLTVKGHFTLKYIYISYVVSITTWDWGFKDRRVIRSRYTCLNIPNPSAKLYGKAIHAVKSYDLDILTLKLQVGP